ncbi:MAG: FRG domain-containing protein, partial [Polyangiaceae bacterium]
MMGGLIIETVHCETAQQFLEKLSPFASEWQAVGGASQWIFRGQAGEWPLTPSALRGPLIFHGIGVSGELRPANIRERLEGEQSLVNNFVSACIQAGMPIPEDSQWLRSARLQEAVFAKGRLRQTFEWGVEFPFPLLRSLFALAQHHGVPTRLLDWFSSRNGSCAKIKGYFAWSDGNRTEGSAVLSRKTPIHLEKL